LHIIYIRKIISISAILSIFFRHYFIIAIFFICRPFVEFLTTLFFILKTNKKLRIFSGEIQKIPRGDEGSRREQATTPIR